GYGGIAGPWSLRAVEREAAQCVSMVKLLELCAAEFAAEAELMLSGGVGNDIGEMCGDIFAAFRRSEADLVKSSDRKIWRTGEIETVIKIQSITGKIEAGVEVIEDLAEIIHSGQ